MTDSFATKMIFSDKNTRFAVKYRYALSRNGFLLPAIIDGIRFCFYLPTSAVFPEAVNLTT